MYKASGTACLSVEAHVPSLVVRELEVELRQPLFRNSASDSLKTSPAARSTWTLESLFFSFSIYIYTPQQLHPGIPKPCNHVAGSTRAPDDRLAKYNAKSQDFLGVWSGDLGRSCSSDPAVWVKVWPGAIFWFISLPFPDAGRSRATDQFPGRCGLIVISMQ